MSNENQQQIFDKIIEAWGGEINEKDIQVKLIKVCNSSNQERAFSREFDHLPLNKEFLKKYGIQGK